MADLLDELVSQFAHDEMERHAKMTPEEIEKERKQNEENLQTSNLLKAEEKYIEKFTQESKINENNEIRNRGKLIRRFEGDTTLLKRTITKLYVFNILTICAILTLLLFYPVMWLTIALIFVMVIGNMIYVSDYRFYKIQKNCFLDVYENAVHGYAYYKNSIGVMDIGFSTVKHISIQYDDGDEAKTKAVFKTIYGDIEFLFLKIISNHECFIIESQRKNGIKNRSRYWTKHKIDWVNNMSKRDDLWDD